MSAEYGVNPITKRRLPKLDTRGVGIVIMSPWKPWVWTCLACGERGVASSRKTARDGLYLHNHRPERDCCVGNVAQAAEHSAPRTGACTSAGRSNTAVGFDSPRGLDRAVDSGRDQSQFSRGNEEPTEDPTAGPVNNNKEQ